MSADLSQFYQVFFEETAEHLAGMEKLLLGLDVSNPSVDNLNAIFRAAHSIKGGAGTFGFNDMAEVTHILETLLDRLRKQEIVLTGEMVNVFLETGDVIAMQLAAHRGEGTVAAGAVDNVCQKLEKLSSVTGEAAKGTANSGGSLADSGSVSGMASDGDADSGFFDDQPGAPEPEQPAPPKMAAPAEPNTKLPERVGAKIEIHGQGFGFFDDEPAAPAKQPPAFGSSTERRTVEIQPRKDILPAKDMAKPRSNSERPATGGGADTDFGFFSDPSGTPALEQNPPKNPTSSSEGVDDEAADQKAKRDFHGKGYGFF